LLKQLEFSFPSQTVAAPGAIVGQAHRLPFEGGMRSPSALVGSSRCDDHGRRNAPTLPFLSSSSERPIHLRGRDHALELEARELLRVLGADKLGRDVRVEWNPRLKTCAGRADYREKLISLNPLLLDHAPRQIDNEIAPDDLECQMHSSLTNDPGIYDMTSELECKMHSSSAKDRGSVSRGNQRREVVSDEVDRTLRHELAHLLAQWRVGRRRIAPHGEEWHRACRDLGIADEARCHNLPFARRTVPPRFVYVCPNCEEKFPRVRRIRRAIACLACCRKHSGGDFDPRFRLKLATTL
jgi:predicted SprT family Zn-dependent metalloprotease